MKLRIDLNADLGEGAGHDTDILPFLTSASIACGAHAGEPAEILAAIRAAHTAGVAIGAHPSFVDRENFGRREISMSSTEVEALVADQLATFASLAERAGAKMRHVKPHGALYNMAARDPALAAAVCRAIAACDRSLILFAPPQSELTRASATAELRVAREFFSDRHYLANGSLVPRSRADALLHDADEAAERVLRLLREGLVRTVDGTDLSLAADTICLHGDSPRAIAFARTLHRCLTNAGIALLPACSI